MIGNRPAATMPTTGVSAAAAASDLDGTLARLNISNHHHGNRHTTTLTIRSPHTSAPVTLPELDPARTTIGLVYRQLQRDHAFRAGDLVVRDGTGSQRMSLATTPADRTLSDLGLDQKRVALLFEPHLSSQEGNEPCVVEGSYWLMDKHGSDAALVRLTISTRSRLLTRSFSATLRVANVLVWLHAQGVGHGLLSLPDESVPLAPSLFLGHVPDTRLHFRPVLALQRSSAAPRQGSAMTRILVRGFNGASLANKFPPSCPLGVVYMWLARTASLDRVPNRVQSGRLCRSYPRRDLPRATDPDASIKSLRDLGLDASSETLLWVEDGAVEARIRATMVELEEERVSQEEEGRRHEKEKKEAEKKKAEEERARLRVLREIEEDRLRRIARRNGTAVADLEKPSIAPRSLMAQPTAAPIRPATTLPSHPNHYLLTTLPPVQTTTILILGNARIQRLMRTKFHGLDPQFPTRGPLRNVFAWIRREVGPVDNEFVLWLNAPGGEKGARCLREQMQGHWTLEELGLGVAASVWYEGV